LENLRNNLGTNEFFDFILKKQNKDGFTALHLASAGGCTRGAILRLLLAAAGPAVSLPTVSSVAGPLHMAAAEGCVKNVDSLLKAGFRASELYNDQTVLITAIKYNHYNTVLRLLEEGDVTLKSVNIHIQSKVTDNPLLFAVLRSAAQIVLALLDAGEDCNIFVVMSSDPTAEPNSLLEIAQRRRDFDTVKVLSTHPSCSDIRLVY
jgi:ankyrin repeat protein